MGLFCVALAGCAANFLVAFIAILLLHFSFFNSHTLTNTVLAVTAKINIVLCAFNLIPIPPLDGSKILMSFLSYSAQAKLARLEPYGIIVLIILIFTGILNPIIAFMQGIIFALISLLFAVARF
jgi:Zn-dependent protease